jgi:hypothetical protein
MDAAFDVKKAAQRADELQVDGAKYCGWGKPRVDASDLDVAISRHLLNHGTVVPDHIFASKMWRVSFIAADLIHQLDLNRTQCALNDETHTFVHESAPVIVRFQDLDLQFTRLVTQQTEWQEAANLDTLRRGQQSDTETLKVQLRSVLVAASAMREAVKDINKVAQESGRVSECIVGELQRADLDSLTGLIDGIEHSRNDYFLLATTMSAAEVAADEAELIVEFILQSCSLRAGEKKAARNMVTEALGAQDRLLKTIVEFEPLIVRQAEWEEQMVQKQFVPQEQ